MKLRNSYQKRLLAGGAFAGVAFVGGAALAAPCPTNVPNPVYGSGGSAVTATIKALAAKVASLRTSVVEGVEIAELDETLVPNPDERTTIFYADPSACTGYNYFVKPQATPTQRTFRYWNDQGAWSTCEADESAIQFAHMGNTPALCPDAAEIPPGFAKFIAPVQIVSFITDVASSFDSISAEAAYYLFKFGAGTAGRTVTPWTVLGTNQLPAVVSRSATSFVHQIIAQSIGLSPFSFISGKVQSTNEGTANDVSLWSNPDQSLGYVSGSAVEDNAAIIKGLAYQHFDQECAYLPDSSRSRKDRLNVRTGQYYLWTPAWVYVRVDEGGAPSDPNAAKIVGWFDGSLEGPNGLDLQQTIVEKGDIPLCAMRAIRPGGDLSPIQSYLPERPCNGYFEQISAGSTDYQACEIDSECTGESQKCLYGFCEDVYLAP